MSSLLEVSELASQPLGTFVYSLLLLLIALATLGMAWGEWRRVGHEQSQRLLVAMAGLVLARAGYLVAIAVARVGGADPRVLLPPLERFVDVFSVAMLGWMFMLPSRRASRAWDLLFAANLALALGACVGSVVLWGRALTGDPSLVYNAYWHSSVWSAWQIGLVMLAMFAATRDRGAGWIPLLIALVVLLLGQVLQLALPLANAAQVPTWERLANLVAYPLIAVAVYQRILADLVIQSRQLQDISQASLDQIKSLLYLVEANQQVSGSLDLTTVLDNAVRGVAHALEADQCAIAFPAETNPSEVRLAAVYSPTRQFRREATSFPLEFQLAIQQAMRRKTHVIIEEADNVQLRALFALLGSSQTGPLLVQPLLENQGAVGALIIGNGQSRRPFGPNEVKLSQALGQQIVLAIQNSRRYRMAQDRIANMVTAQNKTRRASLQARAEIQELTERLSATRREIDALRQARESLEIELVSGRTETDALNRRVAALELELARGQTEGAGGIRDPEPSIIITNLKEPMTTIVGYVDLLLSEATGNVGEPQRKYLLRIKSSAEQVLRAIRSIGGRRSTDSSRTAEDEEQKGAMRRQSVEVSKLVARAVAASRAQFEYKTLALEVSIAETLPPVMADPDHLQWILACLLSNACLASPDGGRVEVQVAHSLSRDLPPTRERLVEGGDGFVSVRIRDTGTGLSGEALGEVFAATRPSQSPPGLGESGATLARVKALIEAHDGWLSVESEEGAGTVFRFSLPAGEGTDRLLAGRLLGERDVVAAT